MWEIHKYGSVRGVEILTRFKYCDTLHIEREEKQGKQNKPK